MLFAFFNVFFSGDEVTCGLAGCSIRDTFELPQNPAVFWSNPRLLLPCTDSFNDLYATCILGETVRAAGRESGLFLSGWHLLMRKLLTVGKPFVWFWLLSLSLSPPTFLAFFSCMEPVTQK